ncbi:MAG: Crp/Fnr family transcriptional regulator [Dysgonamonadaceae bacterium]|jgi:CRP-like cAMP-binding protein|nr:Crp/Fnr family transcriptional regulator [Dysgonamonadaceae bacterium]
MVGVSEKISIFAWNTFPQYMDLSADEISDIFSIPLFRGFSEDMKAEILNTMDYRIDNFPKGETIIRQGATCKYLHILLKGKMHVDVIDISGNEVRVETIKAPRTFAMPHIFSEKNQFPASFTVIEDVTLLRATKDSVFKIMNRIPQFLQNFLCVSANCNKCTMARLRVLSFRSIRNRFICYLLDHLHEGSNTVEMEHNVTQLADYLGVTRPALSNEISKLISEGVLHFASGNQIIVGDRYSLSRRLN